MTPIHVTCPQCHAKPGERCHDYRGVNCAPHRNRVKANATADDIREHNVAQAEAQERKHPTTQPTLF